MQAMTVDQLREAFLSFFEKHQHLRVAGASLVPHNDPTLLLTAAGMVPFKPYFLGQEEPPCRRITSCQRCVRTPDIDNVGITDRHATFFEMLGNFSFGDYFKKEAIPFAWEFCVDVLKIAPERLWVTIYEDDDEAYAIWRDSVGVPAEKIGRLGKEDNWWGLGIGPCGPCSEIYVDRGPELGCGKPDCRPGCDCERFMEIWNLVFNQYDQAEDGTLSPLERTGIDTGMGLERLAAMLQGVSSIFDTDVMRPIVTYIAEQAGVQYRVNPKHDVSLRVISDHMRSVTFMIHDGILPGNEGRGYVLRRLLRRAVRHARLLGIERSFLSGVVDVVVRQMQAGYPELVSSLEYIKRIVNLEEQRFHETLDQGMEILQRLIESVQGTTKEIKGDDAFRLHDTFGFPLELTMEIAADKGVTVDTDGFNAAMEKQRERARAARAEQGYLGADMGVYNELDLPAGEFLGYDTLEASAEIVGLVQNEEPVGRLQGSGKADIILAATPFYPEGGGQVADKGVITGAQGSFHVERVFKTGKGVIVHSGVFTGDFELHETVSAKVQPEHRMPTARNHTATHLLHKSLHEVIGEHANQAGSLVSPERLRFDFNHYEAISVADLAEIERRVNAAILRNMPVITKVTSFDAAVKAGAMALFDEKYGDKVRIVSVGDYSMELCGGTHVRSSGEIGLFRIVSEGSIASGVRRIEAVTGEGALQYIDELSQTLESAAARLQVTPRDVPQQIDKVMGRMKQLEKEINELKGKLVGSQLDDLLNQAIDCGGIKVLAAVIPNADMTALCELGDRLKERMGPSALALSSGSNGKVHLVMMATTEAVAKGVHAGNLIRKVAEHVDGKGGGMPTMARAGGKNPAGQEKAMAAALEALREVLGG